MTFGKFRISLGDKNKNLDQFNQSLQLHKQIVTLKLNVYKLMDSKALSAAQIRYLRIGPRANQSKVLKQQLIQAIEEEQLFPQIRNKQQGPQFQNGLGTLNRIPKYGYSELSKTVNNFGILMNHNFGNSSSLHQVQKFGKLAKEVCNIMEAEKDKPSQQTKKSSVSRINQKEDKRTSIKSIYNYQGEKVFVVLHSFSIQAIDQNYKETFPFSEMKVLVLKVSSAKLSHVIQTALRFETDTVEMNFEKLKEKTITYTNNEQKYQNLPYKFEKIGTEFKINLPYLEFSHIESNFEHTATPSNKDILDILKEQFDNVHDIVYKYFDHEGFARELDGGDNLQANAIGEGSNENQNEENGFPQLRQENQNYDQDD